MNDLISLLQHRNLVWQGALPHVLPNKQSSGYAELDTKLDGGFPQHGVVDISSPLGIGEMRLLMPFVRKQQRLLVYINPPGKICAQQLFHYGIDIEHALVINTQKNNDALWAAENCIKSGVCAVVLLWHNNIEVRHIKRLQVSAEKGDSLLFIYRPLLEHAISLPVTMGMSLTSSPDGVAVHIRKRKGGWPIPQFAVDMREHWPVLTRHHSSNIVAFPTAKAI